MAQNLSEIFADSPLSTFQSADLFYVVRGNTDYGTTFADLQTAMGGGVPTTITVANEASDATCFPLFVTAATGNLGPKTNAGLAFDSGAGVLSVTGLQVNGNDVSIGGTFDAISTVFFGGAVSIESTFSTGGTFSTESDFSQGTRTLTFSGCTYTFPNEVAAIIPRSTGTSHVVLAAPSTGSPITYTLPTTAASLAPLVSPSFTTPSIGVATATSLAIGGATISGHALAVTGTCNFSGNITGGGAITIASQGIQTRAGSIGYFSAVEWTMPTAGILSWNNLTFINHPSTGTLNIGTNSSNALGSIALLNLTASGHIAVGDGIAAPSATAGQAKIYVDTADGDLKVIFADGTIKTIVTDT